MAALERRDEFRTLLQSLAESLDISDPQYEAAVKHYEAVGEWLNKADSPIAIHNPEIYTQGSFRLGTMIKPINDADEYDIDLVCELKNLQKESVSHKQLKQIVGDRLNENELYRKMLAEGNRCWKLQYADSARFHMDILPAIPTEIARSGLIPGASGAILITDKELSSWQLSNPVGYADWFKTRMLVQYNAKRMLVAESLRASVQEIPDYKVKTPLQRSIQILKRHRDIMFADDRDDSPISIIISTLAALAYNNEADLLDAFQNIVNDMPRYIENRDGVSWVSNPVDPLENFADKWQKYPQREAKFRQWLRQIQADMGAALKKSDMRDMAESLKPRFGDRIINGVLSKAFPARSSMASVVLPAAPRIIISTPSKPWGM